MTAAAIKRDGIGADVRWRYVAAICLGSFLLFLVQPMIARLALPRLGGAPAVWNSAMLVYQGLLLAGYAYAHWLGRLQPRRQAAVHLALFVLAALALPIGLSAAVPPPDANPFLWVPWLLIASIGPLFFVISAQAPLIQRWYALAGSGDPYPLYAASNFGSFAGLIAYPLLVEPMLAVAEQRWLWSAGYVLLCLLVGWCALGLPRKSAREQREAGAPVPPRREIAFWILLAAVPSGLILSTTLHLTTDVGAMPLLWVIPLGLYLLSFTVAFAENRLPARAISAVAPFLLLLASCGLFLEANSLALFFGIAAVLNLLAVSVALHSRLFERRPDAEHLTLFYLALSVGGVIGGIFCALLAPLMFDWTYEHLILLVAAALLLSNRSPFSRFAKLWTGARHERWLTFGGLALVLVLAFAGAGLVFPSAGLVPAYALFAILAVAIVAIGNRWLLAASVAAAMLCAGAWERLTWSAEPGRMTRSFFGIYTVRPDGPDARMLVHGTTVHGVQNLGSPQRERMATTYYAPQSGVGLALTAAPRLTRSDAVVSVVGLGAGTLACYARPGQRWTFYEIDPAVVAIARDPRRFTFLSRCLPDAPTVVGDARLTLERAPPASADVLVIDAFSSDSVPMHLLTREAFGVYRRHLRPDGLLLVHISNRYLDLQPVVAAAAADGGWHGRVRSYRPDAAARAVNHTGSLWVALSTSEQSLSKLASTEPGGWRELRRRGRFAPWTDGYASLLPLIRWH